MENNCLITRKLTVEVVGISTKSKEEAIQNAFSDVQNQVRSIIDGTLIYIKPVEVFVKNLEVMETTERFLMLLFPRKKEKVKITLQIIAEISVIQL